MRDDISVEQAERFWAKVEPFKAGDACWIWTGRLHRGKYGEHYWRSSGRRLYARAHRLAYQLLVGDPGETLDHLCRNTRCVNPDHLEPVSASTNVRRGFGGSKPQFKNGVRVCPLGHEVVGDNAMPQKDRPTTPRCRACSYEAVRQHRERKKAA